MGRIDLRQRILYINPILPHCSFKGCSKLLNEVQASLSCSKLFLLWPKLLTELNSLGAELISYWCTKVGKYCEVSVICTKTVSL
jgi:hypothetical protein